MAESTSLVVPVEEAASKPYDMAVAYPDPDEAVVRSRIHQLQSQGVASLVFEGPLRLDKVSVLGKGVAAMVVVGVVGGRRVAVKIRRVDSRRRDMFHEAEMLQRANSVGVGPGFVGVSADVLVMELVEGRRLPDWLSSVKGGGRKKRVKTAVRGMLDQCRRLDSIGLDHGELSRAHKNILVGGDDRPWILDFESSSLSRRPRTLTSLAQYLFLGGRMAERVGRVLGPIDRAGLLRLLREYKHGDKAAFDSAMSLLGLA